MAARERHQPHAADRVFSLAAKLSSAVDKTARSPRLQDTLPDEELRLRKEQPRIAEAPPGVHDLHAGPQRDGLRPASRGQDQQNAKRVMAAFRKACREKHFKEARRLQSQLEEMGVDTEEFQALRRRLATDIAADVKYLIDVGASHYSRQHYAEALKVWSQAQALDPGNEQLSARIKRVTRVLKKLQALREKGAP